jgi:AcrR family transcriptional regulator
MRELASEPSRRARERSRHRSEILAAALKLLLEKGYHNVTMREIAAEAEFATGTLYNHFDGKEALYAELVKTFTHAFLEVVLPSLEAEGDARQRISRYIRATIGLMAENAVAVQLYYRQMQALPEGLKDPEGEVTRLRGSALQKLSDAYASGVRSGLFRDLPPVQVATCLSGVIEAIGSAGLEATQDSSADEMAALVEDMFFHGVATKGESARTGQGIGAGCPKGRNG